MAGEDSVEVNENNFGKDNIFEDGEYGEGREDNDNKKKEVFELKLRKWSEDCENDDDSFLLKEPFFGYAEYSYP